MKNLDSIIVRYTKDDFEALVVADALQKMEFVDVLTIGSRQVGAIGIGSWYVYAKFDSKQVTTLEIDEVVRDVLRRAAVPEPPSQPPEDHGG